MSRKRGRFSPPAHNFRSAPPVHPRERLLPDPRAARGRARRRAGGARKTSRPPKYPIYSTASRRWRPRSAAGAKEPTPADVAFSHPSGPPPLGSHPPGAYFRRLKLSHARFPERLSFGVIRQKDWQKDVSEIYPGGMPVGWRTGHKLLGCERLSDLGGDSGLGGGRRWRREGFAHSGSLLAPFRAFSVTREFLTRAKHSGQIPWETRLISWFLEAMSRTSFSSIPKS